MIINLDKIESSAQKPDFNSLPLQELLIKLVSCESGLSGAEAQRRLTLYGYNEIAQGKPLSLLIRLFDNLKNPLIILLSSLGLLSYFMGDIRTTVVIVVMVLLGVVLRFFED